MDHLKEKKQTFVSSEKKKLETAHPHKNILCTKIKLTKIIQDPCDIMETYVYKYIQKDPSQRHKPQQTLTII